MLSQDREMEVASRRNRALPNRRESEVGVDSRRNRASPSRQEMRWESLHVEVMFLPSPKQKGRWGGSLRSQTGEEMGWKLLRVKIHYVASKKARKSIGVWFLILYIAEIKHFFKLFLLITF